MHTIVITIEDRHILQNISIGEQITKQLGLKLVILTFVCQSHGDLQLILSITQPLNTGMHYQIAYKALNPNTCLSQHSVNIYMMKKELLNQMTKFIIFIVYIFLEF